MRILLELIGTFLPKWDFSPTLRTQDILPLGSYSPCLKTEKEQGKKKEENYQWIVVLGRRVNNVQHIHI